MRTMKLELLLAGLFVLAFACGPDDDPDNPPPNEHEWVKEARVEFPDAISLHTEVIQRSCAPLGGVCHNNKEFPDLHTVGNFISVTGKPCNLDEEDPAQIHDGCEPEGDMLRIPSFDFTARIAFYGPEMYDDFGNVWRDIELTEPATGTGDRIAGEFLRDNAVYVDVPANIIVTAGSKHAQLVDMYYLEYSKYLALYNIVGGDPNQNGILGADELGWAEVVRGQPDRSYLLQRVLGTVPGTRMPLANQPLSNPEYVALICWIETMDKNPQPEQRIDYTHCNYARNPQDYAIE